jgi:anti-sigma B factor antagonist
MSNDPAVAVPFEANPLLTRTVLRIERRRHDRSQVITLAGELDVQTAAQLRAEVSAALEERPLPAQVRVDLGDVTFVDSLGLGTLVVGQRICSQLGVRLEVCNPSPFVARLLEVSGFAQQLGPLPRQS